jgi:branched-chain amino acid transport system ATP-binding protein
MAAALEISNLQAWYGESHILHNVNLTVQPGEVVTLLGRNGAGRTTTLRAIMGLTGARKRLDQGQRRRSDRLPTHRIAHLGVGYCPEERGIFSSLSTEENLLLPPQLSRAEGHVDRRDLRDVPQPEGAPHSQGTRLSGGEQQMLAVARILRTGARLLLLDEISEGLAPVIVQGLARMITTLKEGLHDRHGGTELPLRRAAGGPVLCDGARPDRRDLRCRRVERQDAGADRAARRLSTCIKKMNTT